MDITHYGLKDKSSNSFRLREGDVNVKARIKAVTKHPGVGSACTF